ncbi:MAG: histidine kinase dimerization/phospho-acceptor domain-containing protein [Gemmatimonadales bacterium]
MSLYENLSVATKLSHVSHRPPISHRFGFYAATAYLIPVVVQVVFPDDPTLTDELVWLVTLAPAFLLSLHYGIKGAFLALLMGTTLFVVVEAVVALNYTPDDWRITVPIYIAYGVLCISVGWLSEELHTHYQRTIDQERMAAVGQLALTVQHEINNALTSLMTESQMLSVQQENLTADQREALGTIQQSAQRISSSIERITRIDHASITTPVAGIQMLDLRSAAPQE